MFAKQYQEIMADATLRYSVKLSLADVEGQWEDLKNKSLPILGGKSITQYCRELDAVLKSGNLSSGVVFKATYFYLTSLDEASKEAFRNQTQRAVGGGAGRKKEFKQLANGAEIDDKLKDQHVQDLVVLDLRQAAAEDRMDEDAAAVENDMDEEGGSSSSTSTAKDDKLKKATPRTVLRTSRTTLLMEDLCNLSASGSSNTISARKRTSFTSRESPAPPKSLRITRRKRATCFPLGYGSIGARALARGRTRETGCRALSLRSA